MQEWQSAQAHQWWCSSCMGPMQCAMLQNRWISIYIQGHNDGNHTFQRPDQSQTQMNKSQFEIYRKPNLAFSHVVLEMGNQCLHVAVFHDQHIEYLILHHRSDPSQLCQAWVRLTCKTCISSQVEICQQKQLLVSSFACLLQTVFKCYFLIKRGVHEHQNWSIAGCLSNAAVARIIVVQCCLICFEILVVLPTLCGCHLCYWVNLDFHICRMRLLG